MLGEKVVLLVLKDDIAKWVEKLAEREWAAKRLVDRALKRLMGQVQAERSGRTTIYRLRAHPSAKSTPTGG